MTESSLHLSTISLPFWTHDLARIEWSLHDPWVINLVLSDFSAGCCWGASCIHNTNHKGPLSHSVGSDWKNVYWGSPGAPGSEGSQDSYLTALLSIGWDWHIYRGSEVIYFPLGVKRWYHFKNWFKTLGRLFARLKQCLKKKKKSQECLAKSQVNWSRHTDTTKWEGLNNWMVFFYLKLIWKKRLH